MTDRVGYIVVTWNQASHQPGLDLGADLHQHLDDAVFDRDYQRAETTRLGRKEIHEICVVTEYLCDACSVHTSPDQPITCADPACACWCRP